MEYTEPAEASFGLSVEDYLLRVVASVPRWDSGAPPRILVPHLRLVLGWREFLHPSQHRQPSVARTESIFRLKYSSGVRLQDPSNCVPRVFVAIVDFPQFAPVADEIKCSLPCNCRRLTLRTVL